jgi:hypothetical protein
MLARRRTNHGIEITLLMKTLMHAA